MIQQHRNYCWAIEQRPVSVNYPFRLPDPEDLFIHLVWEKRQGIGVYSLCMQHAVYVNPHLVKEPATEQQLLAMSTNIVHEMAEMGVLSELGWAGYTLRSATLVRPEIHREHTVGAVSCIQWVGLDGKTAHVETYHDLQRKSKEAKFLKNLFEPGTISILHRNDQWHVDMRRGFPAANLRNMPEAPSTYRNTYSLGITPVAKAQPLTFCTMRDGKLQPTASPVDWIVFDSSGGHRLATKTTVKDFSNQYIYAMVMGEEKAHFYLTDRLEFSEISPAMRVGVIDRLIDTDNPDFTPERSQYVRVLVDRGSPVILLESGLVVMF